MSNAERTELMRAADVVRDLESRLEQARENLARVAAREYSRGLPKIVISEETGYSVTTVTSWLARQGVASRRRRRPGKTLRGVA